MKRTVVYFVVILAAVLVVGLNTGCDNTTDPNQQPVLYTLDIYPIVDSREALINSNFELGGRMWNVNSEPMRGYIVNFYLDPDSLGNITRAARLESDSTNGFHQTVMFYGIREGVVLITGRVNKPDGSLMAQDTLYLKVHNPVNG